MALLLPRVLRVAALRIAVLTLAILTLISLPTLRADRSSGNGLTPSVVWAGGSPDETLKPPATPPRSASITRLDSADHRTADTLRSSPRLTALQRWEIFVRVFRTFATRF